MIVLDDSASLSYRSGASPEFERLKGAAIRLLSWLHQEASGDPVTLYFTSSAGKPVLDHVALSAIDLSELSAQLSRRTPVDTPAHPLRVFTELAERHSAADITAMDIYVLSDFQRSDWLAAGEGGPSVFAPLTQLSVQKTRVDQTNRDQVRVILVASGVQSRDNVALIGLELERPQTITGFPAVVRAQVANYSPRPVGDLVVQVEVNGSPLPAVPVGTLAPGEQKDLSLEVSFPDDGYRELALSLGPVDSFARMMTVA